MYRFMRFATVKNSAHLPKVMGFGTEVTGYFKKHYDIDLKFGAQRFGELNLYWFFDFDELNRLEQINNTLIADKTYWAMVDKVRDYWLDGSLRDIVIELID